MKLVEELNKHEELNIDILIDYIRKFTLSLFVIEGEAGVGKSSLLKILLSRLSEQIPDKMDFIPIYLRAIDIVDIDESLEKFIFDKLLQRGFTEQMLHIIKESKRLIIGVDGIDEILVDKKRKNILVSINKFRKLNPTSNILVTSRKMKQMSHKDGIFDKNLISLTIEEFEKSDIRRYIEKWTQKSEEYNQRLTLLSEDMTLSRISKRPLLLNLIMILLDQNIPLPKRKALIYLECIETFLVWDRLKGLKSIFDINEKRRVLTRVSYSAHLKDLDYFSDRDLVDQIKYIIGEKPELIQTMQDEIKRSELLVSRPEKGYTFVYRSFYELLVAKYLFDNGKALDLLNNFFLHKFREIIVLYAGLSEADENPMLELMSRPDDILFYRRQILYDLIQETQISKEKRKQILSESEELAIWNLSTIDDLKIEYNRLLPLDSTTLTLRFMVDLTFNINPIRYAFTHLKAKEINKIIIRILTCISEEKLLSSFISRIGDFIPFLQVEDTYSMFQNLEKYILKKEIYSSPRALDILQSYHAKNSVELKEIIELPTYFEKNDDLHLLKILDFLLTKDNKIYVPNEDRWLIRGIFSSETLEELQIWKQFLEEGMKILPYKILVLIDPILRIRYFTKMVKNLTYAEWENYITGLFDFFGRNIHISYFIIPLMYNLPFGGFIVRNEADELDISKKITLFDKNIETFISTHLENLENITEIYQNIISGQLLFANYDPDQVRGPLQTVGAKLIDLARNDMANLDDIVIINASSLFLMFEEGREKIKKIVKTIEKKYYNHLGLETCIMFDDFTFLTEIPFYALVNHEDRILIKNVVKGDEQSILMWLEKFF